MTARDELTKLARDLGWNIWHQNHAGTHTEITNDRFMIAADWDSHGRIQTATLFEWTLPDGWAAIDTISRSAYRRKRADLTSWLETRASVPAVAS